MSSGHHKPHDLTEHELDDLLDEVLANAKIKARLARTFELTAQYDMALLGSSSIGGHRVHLDRHLHEVRPVRIAKDKTLNTPPGAFRSEHLHRNGHVRAYGIILVKDRPLDVKPGLIRHERLEQALEDELGWPYDRLAHPVAQHWEERDYRAKGFDPKDVEKAFRPHIKHDEAERIVLTPTDLDMRPLLAPPRSDAIIARINAVAQTEKRDHSKVGYVARSNLANQRCGRCKHFIEPKYGGPACTGVKSPIAEEGWCRRFMRGILGATE